MKLVIFGLTVSSSWGNGHATLWRGLIRSLVQLGHKIVFFERDVPYYANERDLTEIPGGELILYEDWDSVRARAKRELLDADVAIITSFCPDGIAAAELIFDCGGAVAAFYDLDTPITLARLSRGEEIPYIGPSGLADFDFTLSYTGGRALEALRHDLGARAVFPLYGHADPEIHSPVAAADHYRADLSYLGTYAQDRQDALARLFVEPARGRPKQRFAIGGAQYPQEFPWSDNIYFVRHLPPSEHPAFFSSSRMTLNVTRRDMAAMGWCPSGRLFEAAACGTAILTDEWDGLGNFYEPGEEILPVHTTEDVLAALDLPDETIARIARAARERTLDQHTSRHRAADLVAICEKMASERHSQRFDQVESKPCGG